MTDYLLQLSPEQIFTLILIGSVATICVAAIFHSLGRHGAVALFAIVASVFLLDYLMGGAIREALRGVR